jgi:hypothetical protein
MHRKPQRRQMTLTPTARHKLAKYESTNGLEKKIHRP